MDRIKILREERGWSQDDAATKLGVGRTTWAGYEQGHRKPDIDTFEQMAELFGVTMDYLKGRSNTPHLTQRQETELSLQALVDIRDKLRRGERGDIPEDEAKHLEYYLTMQIERIQGELNSQK